LADYFKLQSDFEPSGDQPAAIDSLVDSVRSEKKFTTLLGVTGSGKTFTVAKMIEKLQRPTLVIAHNKTLAAQLCSEYKAFFPENSVEYFISYYDYYQPEAYIPYSDTYIEKDASINKEIDRMRHAATQALLLRRDVIIVASVSCIYGLGSPDEYRGVCLELSRGMETDRDELLRKFVEMQYSRTDDELESGRFRVKGGNVEISPSDRESVIKLEFLGDELERITLRDPYTGNVFQSPEKIMIFPATHYVFSQDRLEQAVANIKTELEERHAELRSQGKELEANRLWERVMYDIEMITGMGFCHGIENYSRHFDGRAPGEPPFTLIDYFPEDLLIVIDESHVTLPQLRAMSAGDRSRKKSLVDYGFRLPSAVDNRPLTFDEFVEKARQVVFTTATPSEFELQNSGSVVEQIIRPTGLIDPGIEIRPSKGQMASLLGEIKKTTARNERTLVTTLTKKMAEDLTEYLLEKNIRARYMHSDIESLDRIQIIYDLRRGDFDVLVGINLLREGLDLPEVSLVAILDADKEGFLRSDVTMIQTIGRAARNINGRVILFADRETESMKKAIQETDRRRAIQIEYNRRYDIKPRSVTKGVAERFETSGYRASEKAAGVPEDAARIKSIGDSALIAAELERKMWAAADALDFETAAKLRDMLTNIERKQTEKKAV